MSKRLNPKLTIGLSVAGAVLIVAAIIIFHRAIFRATTSTTQVISGGFTLQLYDQTTPGVGQLRISGDCASSYLYSNNGIFDCPLTKTVPVGDTTTNLQISSLQLMDFTTDTNYDLPLTLNQAPDSGDANSLQISRNTTLTLRATVNTDGTVTVQQYQNGSWVAFPSS